MLPRLELRVAAIVISAAQSSANSVGFVSCGAIANANAAVYFALVAVVLATAAAAVTSASSAAGYSAAIDAAADVVIENIFGIADAATATCVDVFLLLIVSAIVSIRDVPASLAAVYFFENVPLWCH